MKNNISTKYNPNQDKLVYATDEPDIPYLWQEYNRSTQNGGNVAAWRGVQVKYGGRPRWLW